MAELPPFSPPVVPLPPPEPPLSPPVVLLPSVPEVGVELGLESEVDVGLESEVDVGLEVVDTGEASDVVSDFSGCGTANARGSKSRILKRASLEGIL